MGFPKIDQQQYTQLTHKATVLATHRGRPTIMLTPDEKIIKHIYRRGLWSSSTIWPYAARFQKAAKKLMQLNINAPKVEAIYHYSSLHCDLIMYPFVKGQSVHQSTKNGDFLVLKKAAEFIGKLHSLGVYFHDLHLGNLIHHNNEFSLVDVSTVKIYRHPLSEKLRIKNLNHLYNKAEDRPLLKKYGWDKFFEEVKNH